MEDSGCENIDLLLLLRLVLIFWKELFDIFFYIGLNELNELNGLIDIAFLFFGKYELFLSFILNSYYYYSILSKFWSYAS